MLYISFFPLSIFIDLYFLTYFLFDFGTDSDFKEILSFLKNNLLIEGPFVISSIAPNDFIKSFLDLFLFVFSLFARL